MVAHEAKPSPGRDEGMGMDDRHPVHYMNVGKSYQASQIRYEK